jgi:hypothetical protein
MPKKEIEAEIREVQESIKRGEIHLDESLRQIEGLQAQIQTIRQDIEAGKKSARQKEFRFQTDTGPVGYLPHEPFDSSGIFPPGVATAGS